MEVPVRTVLKYGGSKIAPPSQFSKSLRLIQGRAVAVLGERAWILLSRTFAKGSTKKGVL